MESEITPALLRDYAIQLQVVADALRERRLLSTAEAVEDIAKLLPTLMPAIVTRKYVADPHHAPNRAAVRQWTEGG